MYALNPTKKKKTISYSFSRYTKSPQTGLKKIGENSPFNAISQMLASVRNIASFFINPNNDEKFISSGAFTKAMHTLFLELYPFPEKDERKIYEPKEQVDAFNKLLDNKDKKNMKNPNEMIDFILMDIHKDLNKKKKTKTKTDPLNKEKVIQDGLNDFTKSDLSIISNTFFWLEIKSSYCSTCNCIFYRLNKFQTIRLDIFQVYQKLKTPLTISKCLDFQKEKKEDSFCQVCKANKQMNIESKIYCSPNFFIFTLNRGNNTNNEALKIPFTIENNIDIGQFLENKEAYSKYELLGIVSISLNENNKYVYCGKCPVDNKWYLFNDENVNSIDFDNNFKNKKEYVPCLLLYKYQKE